MIPIERHQKILALVAERGVVSIAELTERLGVSHMTIRRDVQKLEEQVQYCPFQAGCVRHNGWQLNPLIRIKR